MHDDVAFEDDLVQRLPMPLAQLYRRAYNAKSPLERHLTAFYLWEAGLKLLASVSLVQYAERANPDPELAERLTSLARPSLGHWWEFARRLVPVLADQGDAAYGKVRDLLLGRTRDDLPRAAGLDAALREALEGKAGARTTVRLSELFDRLVRYRNQELGHGAAGRRSGDFYPRMGKALLAGVAEVLGRLDVLAGRRLIYTADVRRQTSGDWLVERFELIGETGRRIPSQAIPEAEAVRLPCPERVYLDAGESPGQPGASCCLHPLIIHDAEATEVLFLNSRRGLKRTEYLCYTNGRVVERPDQGAEPRELLARALGMRGGNDPVGPGPAPTEAEEPAGEPGDSAPGSRIGEFELISELGRGGMGIVYRAWQPSLNRQVALKKLQRTGDAKAEARFAREIHALGRVEHSNLVKIFTSGADGDEWFYAMELVEGAPLADVCATLQGRHPSVTDLDVDLWQKALTSACAEARKAEKPLSAPRPPDEVPPERQPAPPATDQILPAAGRSYIRHMVQLMAQVADAAHALHEGGILHRDIKPGNVMVTADGRQAVLMDLGLAQLADDVEGRLTRTRQFVGTLRYASPEQVLAVGRLDRRSDVYNLGATLFEVLTLRPLYGASEQTPLPDLLERIQFQEPGHLQKFQIPKDLDAVVLKCLEKERTKRYATARDLADDLRRFLDGRPVKARPVGKAGRFWRWCRRTPAIAGLAATALLAVLVTFVMVTWKWVEADHALQNEKLAREQADLALQNETKALQDAKLANARAEERRRDLVNANSALERKRTRCPGRMSTWPP